MSLRFLYNVLSQKKKLVGLHVDRPAEAGLEKPRFLRKSFISFLGFSDFSVSL